MMLQKRKKLWIWIASIVGALILIIGIAAIYLSSQWKPLLSEKIKEGVHNGSKGLYQIDFKDIHLNLLTGSVVLDTITLTPDTLAYNKLKLIKQAPTHIFRVRLNHLKLSRVGILTAYFKKQIKMDAIILDHPSIDIVYQKVPRRVDTNKNNSTLYQQIAKSLKSIQVDNIKVIDADFDYYNGPKKLNAIKHLTVNVKDVLIDSASQFDTTRVLHAKNIGFELNGYQSLTKDKMYTLKIDSVSGSINSRTLKVKGLKLIPMYADLAFSRKYQMQKDRYDLNFSSIEATGVDFLDLNTNGNLYAKNLTIGPAKVAVFLNRELPPPSFDKGRNYPHKALKRLPIAAVIENLRLNKVDIAYTEYNPKTNDRGTLKLDNLTGSITNITNDSARLAKNNHAKADLTTFILGTGKLNVKIDFNLTDAASSFSYIGHVSPFNMKILNPMAKALGEVEIESGNVKQADFNIQANERGSRGTVKFLYTDLKVKLLKEDEKGKTEKKGLLSFLANTILIKNDNPSEGEPVRTANVTMTRVPQASFFNLMWKSVFVGIRENVGIGFIPMKGMPKPETSKKEERKQKRAARRAEREKS
jgi:hypothetical protein